MEYAPVAQLDRALDSDSKGRWFESSRAYQSLPLLLAVGFALYCFCNKKWELTFLINTPHCIFLKMQIAVQ